VESSSHLAGSRSHFAEFSSHLVIKIKIHQTSFNCALQNFKIDVDIAIV
jgi:hypothetical protein